MKDDAPGIACSASILTIGRYGDQKIRNLVYQRYILLRFLVTLVKESEVNFGQ